jgi:hypothetical protein
VASFLSLSGWKRPTPNFSGGSALDRHVGERQQLVEDDAVTRGELFLVRLFSPTWSGGSVGPTGL